MLYQNTSMQRLWKIIENNSTVEGHNVEKSRMSETHRYQSVGEVLSWVLQCILVILDGLVMDGK